MEATRHDFTASDGVRLSWAETGAQDARPVVLLHGLFSDAETNWLKFGHAARIAGRGFRAAADETDVLKAVLAGRGGTDLCLRPKLVERRNASDFLRFSSYDGSPPKGFEGLRTPRQPDDHRFAEKHVPLNIANRWRLSAEKHDLCAVLTIPKIIGDRAFVSLSFDVPESERLNFWLQRVDGRWRVAAVNRDHHHI